jgi:hypothetical protein
MRITHEGGAGRDGLKRREDEAKTLQWLPRVEREEQSKVVPVSPAWRPSDRSEP